MFKLSFSISNPFSSHSEDSPKNYFNWNKKLNENWSVLIQICQWRINKLFEIEIDTHISGSDHAGPELLIELIGFMIHFKIYNNNHWDYENNKWL